MTDPNSKYWERRQGAYLQPQVIEPPMLQNPNNARHAIWHLGRYFDIEVYPTKQGWEVGNTDASDTGRHDRGEPEIVQIYGTIQPIHTADTSAKNNVEQFGERSEGKIVVHVDSHQEENITAALANPVIFPNGVRLLGPDDEGTDDRFNFATVIRFRNRRWKVMELMELFEGGDENLDFEGAIYRAVCTELRDRSHERNATNEVRENSGQGFWGGEYP